MRLFVTGSSSSFVKEILYKVDNVNIVNIKNLTNAESNKMEFDSISLQDFQKMTK